MVACDNEDSLIGKTLYGRVAESFRDYKRKDTQRREEMNENVDD